ncbi:MAG: hypothetical protein ACOX3Z_02915 [Bacillota bacterium]
MIRRYMHHPSLMETEPGEETFYLYVGDDEALSDTSRRAKQVNGIYLGWR